MADTISKPKFQDLAQLDAKIPPNMMMTYQGKPYILKAGLEYKASQVFGTGGYSMDMDIVERDDNRIVVKATMTTREGMHFVNFGECNKLNTPPTMTKYALHLAITRAECRVLRMATACGYVAIEEMDTNGDAPKELPVSETDGEFPTPAQIKTLASLGYEGDPIITQKGAKEKIAQLLKEKK